VSRYAGLVAILCLFSASCGYHTAGKANLLPSDLRTIAVPAFVNQTQTFKIEQMLTAAVVQEFGTRTNYHIVSDPGAADAV
jgi:Lipopolysaccharide-assembly